MELNKYQRLYIQTVYDYFRENLQWPTFKQVQRKILPTHRDFRVVEVAKSIEDNQAAHFSQNLASPPDTLYCPTSISSFEQGYSMQRVALHEV